MTLVRQLKDFTVKYRNSLRPFLHATNTLCHEGKCFGETLDIIVSVTCNKQNLKHSLANVSAKKREKPKYWLID